MFKRILIPLDGSQLAESALLPAMALAQVSGGEILLLNVPFVREVYRLRQQVTGHWFPTALMKSRAMSFKII